MITSNNKYLIKIPIILSKGGNIKHFVLKLPQKKSQNSIFYAFFHEKILKMM